MLKNYNLAAVAIRDALLADAALAAWCSSTFGKSLSGLLGNREPRFIGPELYPLVMVVAQDSEINADEVNIGLGFGLIHDDMGTALARLGEMQELVFNALFNTPAFSVRFSTAHPDGQAFHPKHHMVLDITAADFTADITGMADFITFHADSQLDADTEPELITEETLPQ